MSETLYNKEEVMENLIHHFGWEWFIILIEVLEGNCCGSTIQNVILNSKAYKLQVSNLFKLKLTNYQFWILHMYTKKGVDTMTLTSVNYTQMIVFFFFQNYFFFKYLKWWDSTYHFNITNRLLCERIIFVLKIIICLIDVIVKFN